MSTDSPRGALHAQAASIEGGHADAGDADAGDADAGRDQPGGEEPGGEERRGRFGRFAAAALLGAVLVVGVAVWTLLLTGGLWPEFQGAATGTTITGRTPAVPARATSTTPRTPIATRGPDLASPGSMTGDKAPTCVNGWETPAAGLAVRQDGLAIIELGMGITGAFQVVDLRHFRDLDGTEWWYVKAFLAEDLDFRGRWLVQRRLDSTMRIVAVAPYDTDGLRSPDWVRFDGKGPPTTYPNLPGRWAGTPYDFVGGATGLAGGLPGEVRGCVAGT